MLRLLCLATVVLSAAASAGPPPGALKPGLEGPDNTPRRKHPQPNPAQRPQPAPPPAGPPLQLTAERVVAGPAPRLVSESARGHFAFTADAEQLVFLDDAGLHALAAPGGAPRTLALAAPSFQLTPDGRFVLIPGAPWKRLSLAGKDGAITLAAGERRHQLSGTQVTNSHLVFICADGPLTVATLDEGTSLRLPIDPPKDGRCHAGAGYPRGASDDGQWLIFQHGCSASELIRMDGTGRRALGLVSAVLVDGLAVGGAMDAHGKKLLKQVHVLDLESGDRFVLDGLYLEGQARRVPGRRALVQTDGAGHLVLLDLHKKSVRRLDDADGVSTFVEVTPDGQAALYATLSPAGCALHQVHLASGKRQRLAEVTGAKQCFIKPAGKGRAVLYAWRAESRESGEAIIASVDLTSGVVRRLGTTHTGVGNFAASPGAVAFTAGKRLYVGGL